MLTSYCWVDRFDVRSLGNFNGDADGQEIMQPCTADDVTNNN